MGTSKILAPFFIAFMRTSVSTSYLSLSITGTNSLLIALKPLWVSRIFFLVLSVINLVVMKLLIFLDIGLFPLVIILLPMTKSALPSTMGFTNLYISLGLC
ncbi:100aa long hypothetical protein [Pyrococcus horikoshii OT3]|uniref:Uncharacterized protein n=1 Tax=Pyrococcus horikoshii (strain ATCC 700860 / DSM 12428 / JCM 9974 / NBRC 100139 / OT-3) TaxID=70601 RepID=O59253_PYRHO|nr:100aa long hypothetical protein [Pyrococcus horikoshii OT3]